MRWSNLVQVFDFKGHWGAAAVRLVEGDDAAIMVKKVENLLADSMKVLKSHQRLINKEEYSTFEFAHRRLELRVVEVKQGVLEQETRDLFTATPAEKQAYRTEIHQLFDRAQIYHRDVLTASRRAQENEERSIFSLPEASSTSLPEPTEHHPSHSTTWYSIITSQPDPTSDDPNADASDSATSSSVAGEPLLAVTHVRDSENDDPNGDEAYRRILIMESKRKRVIMIDPNPCYLKDGAEPGNESTLLEMSRAGVTLFRATDPENLEQYQAIAKQEEPSWVDSMIQSMARLGVGAGSKMM